MYKTNEYKKKKINLNISYNKLLYWSMEMVSNSLEFKATSRQYLIRINASLMEHSTNTHVDLERIVFIYTNSTMSNNTFNATPTIILQVKY